MPGLTAVATRPARKGSPANIEIIPLAEGQQAVTAVIAGLGASWDGSCAHLAPELAIATAHELVTDPLLVADELVASAAPEFALRALEGHEIWITWGP